VGRKYQHPDRRPAVISGASSGIGAETARKLAAAGFPVALGARRVDRLEEIVSRIRAEGGEDRPDLLEAATHSIAGAARTEVGERRGVDGLEGIERGQAGASSAL